MIHSCESFVVQELFARKKLPNAVYMRENNKIKYLGDYASS